MQVTLNPADRDVLGKSARTFAESLAGTIAAAASLSGGLPHTGQAIFALAGSAFATAACAAWHTAKNASTGKRRAEADRIDAIVNAAIAADRAARPPVVVVDPDPVVDTAPVAGAVLLPTPQS